MSFSKKENRLLISIVEIAAGASLNCAVMETSTSGMLSGMPLCRNVQLWINLSGIIVISAARNNDLISYSFTESFVLWACLVAGAISWLFKEIHSPCRAARGAFSLPSTRFHGELISHENDFRPNWSESLRRCFMKAIVCSARNCVKSLRGYRWTFQIVLDSNHGMDGLRLNRLHFHHFGWARFGSASRRGSEC